MTACQAASGWVGLHSGSQALRPIQQVSAVEQGRLVVGGLLVAWAVHKAIEGVSADADSSDAHFAFPDSI